MSKTPYILILGALAVAGCKSSSEAESKPKALASGPYAIVAKSGSSVSGTVTLKAVEGGVRVVASVENAPPGEHGTHIHDKADCSADDGKSAGGHFDPGGHDHALPETEPRHLGDLGNLTVGEDGKGRIDVVRKGANLKPGDERSFLGRALIFHAKVDDGGQPTGNAGARLGCAELTAN